MAVILLKIIKIYQVALSPLKGRVCRFYPSCSEYARLSIQKQGWAKGLLMSAKRLARCHPLTPGGIDTP